ncbi:adenylyl cyclase-associated protein 1-like isoform X2 [Ptychodera flava]|uniref:adenylyl cyclase-associated protein 1-like isoform X2 n=1 Tax=Ptychodera flava TaxID=63121 RepID=UPI00396A2D1B
MSVEDLTALVSRLEEVTSRLESVAGKGGGAEAAGISASLGKVIKRLETVAGGDKKGGDSAILGEFDKVLSGSFANYLALSKEIGGDVATHADMVSKAFQAQREFMAQVAQCKEPKQDVFMSMLRPTSSGIEQIQQFRERNRGSKVFNHLSAVSEGIPVLGWVTMAPKPAPYVKDMGDAAQFYTNRVLKEYKEKDEKHVKWTRAFMAMFTEMQAYVKEYHTTGLAWNKQGRDATGPAPASAAAAAPPPPAGAPPPPPPGGAPVLDIGDSKEDPSTAARAALFSDLNKGEGITSGLKKVTSDMQTHKNPALRKPYQQGPTPYKSPTFSSVTSPTEKKAGPPPVAKKPAKAKLEMSGSKWLVEHHEGNKNIVVETTALKQTVYIYKCNDSTIQVKGKVNSIVLDGCKKTGVAFDSLVSSFDVINCQSVQIQVMEVVPTISIDKTDGCQIYLSKDSLDTAIITAKSSAMNVLVPTESGEFSEHPVPEQFRTNWNKATRKLVTELSENIA